MAREIGRIELKLDRDARLTAGVTAAVIHVAESAGLGADAQADLVVAAEDACCEAFRLLTAAGARLGVTIEKFTDRIEVILEYRVLTAQVGRETSGLPRTEPAQPAGSSGRGLLGRVDHVLSNTQGGTSRTTLVKYTRAQPKQK